MIEFEKVWMINEHPYKGKILWAARTQYCPVYTLMYQGHFYGPYKCKIFWTRLVLRTICVKGVAVALAKGHSKAVTCETISVHFSFFNQINSVVLDEFPYENVWVTSVLSQWFGFWIPEVVPTDMIWCLNAHKRI